MSVVQIAERDVRRLAETFLPAPLTLGELAVVLRDPDVDLDDVTSRLRPDPALTGRLVRIANSAAFAASEPVSAVEDAVALIGLAEVHRVVGLALLEHVSETDLDAYGITSRQFRENSLLSAILMEELAPGAGQDPRSCYTIGLMRSIGKSCLDALSRGLNRVCIPRREEETAIGDWETLTFGTSANAAGAIILDSWKFSAEFSQAVARQYDASAREHPHTRLLAIASSIADFMGHGLPGESSYWMGAHCVYNDSGMEPREAEALIERSMLAFRRLIASL